MRIELNKWREIKINFNKKLKIKSKQNKIDCNRLDKIIMKEL